jgi:hypothetical protein
MAMITNHYVLGLGIIKLKERGCITIEAKYRAGLRVAFLSQGHENSGGALTTENMLKPAWDVSFVMHCCLLLPHSRKKR